MLSHCALRKVKPHARKHCVSTCARKMIRHRELLKVFRTAHLSFVLSLVVISMAERHGGLCDQWNCSVQCPVPFAPSMAAFFRHHDCGPSILRLSIYLLLFGYDFIKISIKNISTSSKKNNKNHLQALSISQLW